MSPSAGEAGPRGVGVRFPQQERGVSPVASFVGAGVPEPACQSVRVPAPSPCGVALAGDSFPPQGQLTAPLPKIRWNWWLTRLLRGSRLREAGHRFSSWAGRRVGQRWLSFDTGPSPSPLLSGLSKRV